MEAKERLIHICRGLKLTKKIKTISQLKEQYPYYYQRVRRFNLYKEISTFIKPEKRKRKKPIPQLKKKEIKVKQSLLEQCWSNVSDKP
jgi:hypothetical protein